ncbi:MAG: SLBB domain-containing protein [Roseateles asaccharophilus]|uniref:Protein involved in polysaccharide export with SLBB domain n=1 Tax=Roseateles asaccharophilus TaxID=582607 RepID=A0A4R6MYA8_9BURK|nr:SLBB domain-containing protein [Roseateles asaccharophilus]MDN3545711.1 SLBB domain-containing protein [Roseateles asaccharophilus]TDP07580.1 protein involved in polysaccharide export with SLBB domain [Roseateles asaccharophilus]
MNVRASRARLNLRPLVAALLAAASLGLGSLPTQAAPLSNSTDQEESGMGPVRLNSGRATGSEGMSLRENGSAQSTLRERKPAPYKPGEFEIYVNKLLGWEPVNSRIQGSDTQAQSATGEPERELLVKRLGAELMMPSATDDAPRQVPLDYVIGIGDEVQLTLWGSVDADLRLTVDNAGRIVVPRVGPILVAGLRYAELNEAISRRVGQVFKNFQASASLGRLRGIRVYVTGFAQRPGSYNISSLSTIVSALMQAGGPSAAGSFRQIELRRAGKPAVKFDLYDLLLKGNRAADLPLQSEDVVHIGPVGAQLAVLGSINKPVIAEIKPGETIDDALNMAGGFNPVADRSRISIERLSERNDRRVTELALPAQSSQPLSNGDILRAFSSVAATLPQHKQYKRVRVEGEVQRPGEYVLAPNSTINEAIQAAGGMTPLAYVFGTEFSRESVRIKQQENYERALRDLETEFARATSTQRALTADESAAQAARATGTTRLIERLRAVKPTGRVVLQLSADATSLPELTLEEGDRIMIPPRPTTVGVFGSVFNNGSFLWKSGSSVDDALRLAGGPTRGADTSSTFVLRANGSVISAQQTSGGWVSFGSALANVAALPGDTVFVPEEMNKTTFMQSAKEWTQILYQFGLGAAALKTIKN